MKQNRIKKNQQALQRMKIRPVEVIDRTAADKNIFDIVLKHLYNNADAALHLENQIYAPNNVRLNNKESERLWEVMISSGWVTPVIGFGNAGKVELTKTGYQLMSQFGGYSEYLTAVQATQQPQTIILPIQIQDDDNEQQSIPLPAAGETAKTAQKISRKSKYQRK
ncbi:MAG: hypothetical protein K0R82_1456 [Flavipsychrobacter sp.]|jgi:hypothetical protein|nr:hypothetical protein [Flavipsychrobacter sp.]